MLIFANFSRYIAKVRHLFIKGLCYRESFVFIRDNFFLRKWARWAFIGYENEYIQIFLMLSKCELKKKLHINMISMCTWNMHACLFTFFLKSSILIDIWRNKTFRMESKTKKKKPNPGCITYSLLAWHNCKCMSDCWFILLISIYMYIHT